MELKIIDLTNQKLAEIVSDSVVIDTAQSALDIMAEVSYQEASAIILHEKNITSAFFDLRSGIAGEILQKYANYRMKLAIIGEFEKLESKSLKAFIIECNRGDAVFFVADRETAIAKLNID